MSNYNTTGGSYHINNIQINKPKSASQSTLDFITSKSFLVLEDKNVTHRLDERDYVVDFLSDKNTNYDNYLEISNLLVGIFDFEPLIKEGWDKL